MKNIMIRSISLILSLVIFASGLPVFAEEDFELVIAEMETSEALPTPTPIPTEMPEDAFELVLAETPTPEPLMDPAPELTTESVVETEQEPAMQEDDGPALETEEEAGQPEIEETIQQPQTGEENVEQETPVPEVSIAPEATETVQPEVSASPEATQIPTETEIPETSEAPEVTASAEATLAPEATLIPEEDIVVAETVEPTAEPALIQSAQELADAFGMSVEELAAALDMSADELCALSPEELTSIHQMLMEMMSGVALLSLEPEFEIDENNRLVAYLGEGGNVVVPDGVVAIGAGAFKNNSTISSVTLPASVVTIEAEAFAGCRSAAQSCRDGFTFFRPYHRKA